MTSRIGSASTDLLEPERVSAGRWMCLGVLFVGWGGGALLFRSLAGPEGWIAHAVWCLGGVLLLAPVLLLPLRRGFEPVLRQHVIMFCLAFAAYFLFGASFMVFGRSASVVRVLDYYPVDARTALYVDAVNAVGFGFALATAGATSARLAHRWAAAVARPVRSVRPWTAILLMVVLGSPGLVFSVAHDIGVLDGMIPGVVRASGNLVLVAVFVAAAHNGPSRRVSRILALIVAVGIASTGVILFNKSQILLPLGVLFLGLSLGGRTRFWLLGGGVVLVVLYVGMAGAVSFGRNVLDGGAGSTLARWNLVTEGLRAQQAGNRMAQHDSWGRLSYVVPQGAAIDLFHHHRGGMDLRLIPWLVVPRVLAPEKPIISASGVDLHEKITGYRNSSTGVGVFVSGYYNLGWLGAVLAGIVCGWILAQTSAIARAVREANAVLLLPLVLLGLFIAFRIDGHVVVDYLGLFVYVVCALLLGSILVGVLPRGGPVSHAVSRSGNAS